MEVTQKVAQYPLHHVTCTAVKFKVATSNALGGDAFERNTMAFDLDFGVMVTRNAGQYPLHQL